MFEISSACHLLSLSVVLWVKTGTRSARPRRWTTADPIELKVLGVLRIWAAPRASTSTSSRPRCGSTSANCTCMPKNKEEMSKAEVPYTVLGFPVPLPWTLSISRVLCPEYLKHLTRGKEGYPIA